MDKELLLKVEIPNFIKEVKIASARRATYFKLGMKLPKKYQDKTKFGYKYFGANKVLYNLASKELVVKNIRVAGKPRFHSINGNECISGYSTPFARNALFRGVKDYFTPFFEGKGYKILDYPIMVRFTIYDFLKVTKNIEKVKTQDLDNLHLIYKKNILDILTLTGIIVDDNLNFLRKIEEEFIPIADSKDNKLVIEIYKYE